MESGGKEGSRRFRILKRILNVLAGLFVVLMVLQFVFQLALIREEVYFVLMAVIAVCGIALVMEMLVAGRRYMGLSLFTGVVALLIAVPVTIFWPFLRSMDDWNKTRIYYEREGIGGKVYFETTGTYFMSDKQFYYLEEADVSLGIFYKKKTRKGIKGGP